MSETNTTWVANKRNCYRGNGSFEHIWVWKRDWRELRCCIWFQTEGPQQHPPFKRASKVHHEMVKCYGIWSTQAQCELLCGPVGCKAKSHTLKAQSFTCLHIIKNPEKHPQISLRYGCNLRSATPLCERCKEIKEARQITASDSICNKANVAFQASPGIIRRLFPSHFQLI